ncbi:Inositol 2-dehydrogenase [Luteitalea pratensis]|uniref:Inositol 2-dehydrogenase n=1 Tax=Luteitalea pratensis TaxID=1855912 RepID=A0A143PJ43_LUTPR|nr:Gfo/Idh/MocA family oxidoreductase [Luteitalea pratensis]AMY08098.1 Inositol 2-dehydrogenase [Luteitalea pratensis]
MTHDLDRRAFLQTGATLAASASLATRAVAQPQVVIPTAPVTGAIATGIIGTGGRGTADLGAVLEHGKVAAVCDVKADRMKAAADVAMRDTPAQYADYRRVLDRKDIEAVVIATPPHLHAEMAVAALQAGKHVYCEKPVAITPASVAQVVKAVKASGKVFIAGQQLRSYKRLGAAVGKIRAGAIGDVLMIKAQRHSESDLSHTGTSADWFFDVEKSGGYLIEMSVHNLDLCNWAIGATPLKAAGFGGILLYKDDPPGRSIMDGYTLSYDYPGGVKLYFTQMVFHPKGLPGGGQFVHVYGQKGACDLMGDTSVYPLDGKAPPAELVPKMEEAPNAHMLAFYECIRGKGTNPADITVGATGALTAIMGHQAITTGKVVEWKTIAGDLS